MKRIALLGGSRFVGFHLLKALHKAGHEVILFNRQLSPPPEPFPKGTKFVKGDRNNPQDLERLFSQRFDAVFDVSGFTLNHVRPIIEKYRFLIGHYVFISSTTVYKQPFVNPLDETSPLDLTKNTYGGDKALVEEFLLNESRENGFPATILRLHGVMGPHDASVAGLVFYRLLHTLPIIISAQHSNRTSYLSVHDLVKVCLSAMNNQQSFGKVYLVAGDEMISAQDFVKLCGYLISVRPQLQILDHTAMYENYRYANAKRGVPAILPWVKHDMVCDNSKVQNELGVRFMPIDRMLMDILAWFKRDPEKLAYFSLRGEQYLLRDRAVPLLNKACWELTDDLKGLTKRLKGDLKRMTWLRENYFRWKGRAVRSQTARRES